MIPGVPEKRDPLYRTGESVALGKVGLVVRVADLGGIEAARELQPGLYWKRWPRKVRS